MLRILAVVVSFLLSPGAVAELPAAGEIPESRSSSFGYPTVQAALDAAKAMPGAEVKVQGGWTIVSIEAESTLWSFAPESNPAYPSAVKRVLVESNGKVDMKMSVLCQAAKKPCDQLVRDFQALNDRMKEQLSRRAK